MGGDVLQLEIRRLREDGSFETVARSEVVRAGEKDRFTVDLARGAYELADPTVERIDGATVDHYAEGMSLKFTVR